MFNSTSIIFNALRHIDSSTFTGSYQQMGTFSLPIRILKITNNSTVDVTVSVDGVADVDFIPAGGFFLYDFGTNKGAGAPALDHPPSAVYVKGSAGTGSVYLTTLSAYTPSHPMGVIG